MSQEVVALDIDDVAVKHAEGFVLWSNENYGTNLTLDDYTEAWHEIWGVDLEETEARKKIFFTDEIVGSFEEIEGAGEGITALAGIRKVIGVTSRRGSLQPITESALEIIAPGAVDRVIFATNFVDGQKVTRSKAEICPEIAATHLIDDQPKHCLAVAEVGVTPILFGEYGWNAPGPSIPADMLRAKNWQEVLPHFE